MLRLEYSPGDGFRVADGPAPSIASDEVLIRVEACGVCGSDRQVVAGESVPPGTAFPLVMGHEIAGQIIEVGADVIGWRQDDLVVVHPFVACGTCAPCLHDQANLCVRQTCIGYHRQGDSHSKSRFLRRSWCGGRPACRRLRLRSWSMRLRPRFARCWRRG
ncbi:alcohol dehydrogenase catalytic domain-containing protein [Alicyclobacillus fastidiosus]|uniref:alcohol dehydrogenase catalytic domain-containing protein n=1 Tax=Alicyclobacillus fastidiosus TaxID=392011 RepID=UPI0024E06A48|nr:alcohol dehydrogenase catalytic domain-containing protein [Alicyclobacillus fastidiosus]